MKGLKGLNSWRIKIRGLRFESKNRNWNGNRNKRKIRNQIENWKSGIKVGAVCLRGVGVVGVVGVADVVDVVADVADIDVLCV